MKKGLISVVCLVTLLLGVSACGKKDKGPKQPKAPKAKKMKHDKKSMKNGAMKKGQDMGATAANNAMGRAGY